VSAVGIEAEIKTVHRCSFHLSVIEGFTSLLWSFLLEKEKLAKLYCKL
jgi:hypothetical protein